MSGGSISISSSSRRRGSSSTTIAMFCMCSRKRRGIVLDGVGDELLESGRGSSAFAAARPRPACRPTALPAAVGAADRRADARRYVAQRRVTAHRSHSGVGLQMRRPCRISVSERASTMPAAGAALSCCSTRSGIVGLGEADAVGDAQHVAIDRQARARRARGRAPRWRSCVPRRAAATSASIVGGTSPPWLLDQRLRHADERPASSAGRTRWTGSAARRSAGRRSASAARVRDSARTAPA